MLSKESRMRSRRRRSSRSKEDEKNNKLAVAVP